MAAAAVALRIARELHDTLLQSAQAMILNVHAVARRLGTDDPRRAELEAALVAADRTVAEGRDRINDLRGSGRTLERLRDDLVDIGSALVRGGDTRFEHETRNAARKLDPEVADEMFSIGREALSNAARHAQASLVRLELADTPGGFVMRIVDNGRGMGDQSLSSAQATGHWGLAGMRDRAARIGGNLTVSSRLGEGTTVELTIRADTAHRASRIAQAASRANSVTATMNRRPPQASGQACGAPNAELPASVLEIRA